MKSKEIFVVIVKRIWDILKVMGVMIIVLLCASEIILAFHNEPIKEDFWYYHAGAALWIFFWIGSWIDAKQIKRLEEKLKKFEDDSE